jgi:hypothetical protein
MGQLVFQATLGGQVNLVGPNTASTFNLNVPAVSSTLATLAAQTFTGTQTMTTLTSPAATNFTLQSAGTTAVTIDTSQNVGIGTTSPSSPIDVVSNSSAVGITLRGRSSESTGKINFVNNANNTTYAAIQTNSGEFSIQGVAAIPTVFYTNNTERMRIDSSGNVGIGTSSPVAYSGYGVLALNGTNGAFLEFLRGGTDEMEIYIDSTNNNIRGKTSKPLVLYTNDTERMRIDSSGNLLVGTTSQINNGTGITGSSSQTSGGVASGLTAVNTNASGDVSPPIAVVKTSTTTSSTARFIQFYANNTATAMGGIVGNGASNVQFAAISDAREKTNIQPISGSLNKILALKPSSFDWIANNEHNPAGFIAQEVQTVFPEFVVQNMANEGDEQRYGLTGGMTGGIIPHLVKAIQELKEINDTQAETINALTARVVALEAK